MADDVTEGVLSASSRTGVLALAADAGLVGSAIRVQDALRSATFVGVPDVIRQTTARPCSVLFPALRIGSARRRHARRPLLLDNRGWWLREAGDERIAAVAGDTDAVWRVADHATFGVGPAASWARVLALLVDAGEVGGALAVANAFRPTRWRGTYEAY